MSLSRRSFVHTMGAGAAGLWIGARGPRGVAVRRRDAVCAGADAVGDPVEQREPARLPQGRAGRRQGRDDRRRALSVPAEEVTQLVATKHNVKPENVLLGSGSTQILRTSTHVFTTKTAGLVAAIPAYEECADYARLMGHPITGVKLTNDLKMDLDALQAASRGAGLVFYCNPNNPVATAINAADTRTYLATLMKQSPNTTVLVDEAYFEYGTMPGYETFIPTAIENPRIIVARTFSKCFGMAGLRIGYAIGHKDTIAKMANWDNVGNISVMALQGAKAALAVPEAWVKEEQRRNAEARSFTQKWFADHGYTPTDSQTNFMFVNIKRPSKAFREECLKDGVLVARDFPPYENSHVRISVGTMAEMQRAVQVFGKVLAAPAKAAAA